MATVTPIPLLTASKGLAPAMRQTVIDTVIRRAEILNILPFITLGPSQGFEMKELETKEGALGSIFKRAINERPDSSKAETIERRYGVKQMGVTIEVEKKVERQIPRTMEKQVRMHLQLLGDYVNNNFFNGDGVANEKDFSGLKKILGSSGSYVVTNSADLTINTDGTTFETFLKLLDEAIRKVNGPANAILVSDVMFDAINAGARKLGADTLGTTTDFLQRQVPAYRGIPFVSFGKFNGTDILGATESDAGGSSNRSAYVVRFDEADGLAGITTNGITINPDEDDLFMRDTIDFDMGLRVPTNSAIRIARLKVA